MSDESGYTPPAPAPAPAAAGGPDAPNAKLFALLGWIFAPLGLIVIFMDEYKGNKWLRQHVIQGAAFVVVLWIVEAIMGVTVILALLAPIVWLVGFIYQIMLALKANKGESVEVPVIYGIVKNMIESA